jgi:hypothetical protein
MGHEDATGKVEENKGPKKDFIPAKGFTSAGECQSIAPNGGAGLRMVGLRDPVEPIACGRTATRRPPGDPLMHTPPPIAFLIGC